MKAKALANLQIIIIEMPVKLPYLSPYVVVVTREWVSLKAVFTSISSRMGVSVDFAADQDTQMHYI